MVQVEPRLQLPRVVLAGWSEGKSETARQRDSDSRERVESERSTSELVDIATKTLPTRPDLNMPSSLYALGPGLRVFMFMSGRVDRANLKSRARGMSDRSDRFETISYAPGPLQSEPRGAQNEVG